MTDQELKLVTGALLHDIGKVVFRTGEDRRKHSQSGFDYLKEEISLKDQEVLDCVRFHHADALKDAKIEKDALAYIVYIADNIAAAADRREKERADEGFDRHIPLQPVFNVLNRNDAEMYYAPFLLNLETEINYPISQRKSFDESQYRAIEENLKDNLKGLEWSEAYINSLMEVLEGNLSYIPSSTSKKELPDISLFDHLKLTAAVASCIYQYLEAAGETDYQEVLWKKNLDFYGEKAFLLVSMDVSGIQKFLYTISSENALRMLRARSFYLEIMVEHMIDMLLEQEHLSRANLIYSGGGHCYLLLPNTERGRNTFDRLLEEINAWFLETFQTQVFIAGAYVPCSSKDFCNEPKGSYENLFQSLSRMLSEKKGRRYSASQILLLNAKRRGGTVRECKVCRTTDHLTEENICTTCNALKNLSAKVLYADFFCISSNSSDGVSLPGGCYLSAESAESLRTRMQSDPGFIRAYGKNKMFSGKGISTRLWVGNYTQGSTTEELAKKAQGIDRIAVVRADVDNLGTAFVSGFRNEKTDDRYMTLCRTATLSRQLSLFFKLYINRILENGVFALGGPKKEGTGRNATIVYSGGDDLFIIGSWDDAIALAVDLRNCFKRYTEGTLTLSAGIGLYQSGYPVSAAAYEVASFEDASKNLPGKDAITLLPDGECHVVSFEGQELQIDDGTYHWEEFEQSVCGEKLQALQDYFSVNPAVGNALLYHLLELLRNQKNKINFARYVYLLSRTEPEKGASKQVKEAYRVFADRMYRWVQNEQDRRELKTAITIYVYLNREREEEAK